MVTICIAAILLMLDLSLAVSLRRLIQERSRAQGAVTAIVYAGIGAAFVLAGGMGSEAWYQTMRQTKWFSYMKTNFLSNANPQVLSFLLYGLLLNFAIVIAGLLIWWFLDVLGRQPKMKKAIESVKRTALSKLTEKRKAKVAPLTVLGKWLWNLANAFLVVLFLETVCGFIAVYVKIPNFSYGRKTQWVYGFFRMPILVSLVSVSFARALSYDAKRSLEVVPLSKDTEETTARKNAAQSQKEEESCSAYGKLLIGTSMRAPKDCELSSFLPDYLYECFQRRRRVIVLCSNKEDAQAWCVSLKRMLTGRFGEICLIRIGDSMYLKNQEDIDILVSDADEFLKEDLQRIWPLWFSQVGFVVLSNTHLFLARTTQADAFFASWKQSISKVLSTSKKDRRWVQYLFLDCTMTAQEKEALTYYAGSEVADVTINRVLQDTNELVPWMLVSPAGIYRRLLLLMQAENGVPESWLIKQKKRFDMEAATTEDFLKMVLSAVLPDYSVQNLYDSFSFEEEPGWPHGKWRVRLSDTAAEALLTKKDEALTVTATGNRLGMLCLPDLVYQAEGMSPLGSVVYQKNKTIQLCQAQIKRTCAGAYFIAETKNADSYNHMIYEKYEEKSAFRKPFEYEAVLLQLTIKCGESSERKQLEQMLSAVCNEVLQTVFPYNKGQITACYMESDYSVRSGIVPRMNTAQITVQKAQEKVQKEQNQEQEEVQREQEQNSIHRDTLTIYLIENQSEQGLATALHQNSNLFLRLCREWLERAINDSASEEAALVDYLMTKQRKDLMLPAASKSAGQIAGLAKLLVGLLSS